jgi:hypothetical protein
MGWDKGRYYTRSRKVAGRVVREYVGGGALGRLAAELDRLARQRRQAEARAERARAAESAAALDALDGNVCTLIGLTDLVTRAALAAAGYHQHARGHWRRRSVSKATPAAVAVPKTQRQRRALLRRAEKGDETVLPVVHELMKDLDLVAFYGGNLAVQLVLSVAEKASGDNLAQRAALFHKVRRLKAELAGAAPTPAEELLAERAAVCWLQMHYYDVLLVQQEETLSLRQAEYQQRRCERAQRRYLAALKALALVRKLALPALQLNVAAKQVNVAG